MLAGCSYFSGASMLPNRPSILPRYFRLVMAGLHRNAVLWGGIVLLIPVLASAETAGSVLAKGNASPVSPPSDFLRQMLDFDIPAQPLADALDQYAAVSHRSVVFRTVLVDGRVSSPVHGRYSPQEALRILLSGSGLFVEAIDPGHVDTFVLKTLGSPEGLIPAQAGIPVPQYDGQAQAKIWATLCNNPQTTPGSYRALIRFHIDSVGRISQAYFIDSSGDKHRDTALLSTLQTIRLGRPPPEMAQPLTMLILPQNRVAGPMCKRKAS